MENLKAKEIVEILNKYPDAEVIFETRTSSGLITAGTTIVTTIIKGYKLVRNYKGDVKSVVFVEDEVVPREK